jgi:hypothetical protein
MTINETIVFQTNIFLTNRFTCEQNVQKIPAQMYLCFMRHEIPQNMKFSRHMWDMSDL